MFEDRQIDGTLGGVTEQRNKDIATLFDHWLSYQRIYHRIPGVVATLTIDGDQVFNGDYGLADVENDKHVDHDTIFRIASISKVFTAVGVMQLVERGAVVLDTPVAEYVDWFRSSADHRIERITVRHLLTHTSGLMRDGNTDHQQSRKFPDVVGLQDDLRSGVSTFEPNTKFKYSNYGIAVLGQLVESVSGQSFVDYQRKNIFDPLGMSRTSTDWQNEPLTNVAVGYSRAVSEPRRPCPAYALGAYAPAFGMYTTANDLSRFVNAMLDDSSLLSSEFKREMFRTQWADGPNDVTWGFGFRTLKIDDRKIIGTSGKFEGFESALAFDIERRIVAIVLTNALAAPALSMANGMIHATNKAIDISDMPTAALKDAKPANFTGLFTSLWGDWLITPIGTRLYGFDPSADRIFDDPNKLSITGPTAARVDTASWSGCLGEEVVFDFDADGQAISATIDGITSTRWSPKT